MRAAKGQRGVDSLNLPAAILVLHHAAIATGTARGSAAIAADDVMRCGTSIIPEQGLRADQLRARGGASV